MVKLWLVKYICLNTVSFVKNARCGQSRALFELDFHISCTGVLFRVTCHTEILLNWPVHDNCKSSKVENRNPGWKHGFWQNYTNLRFQFSVVAIGTQVLVYRYPARTFKSTWVPSNFSDKNISTACTGLRRRQDLEVLKIPIVIACYTYICGHTTYGLAHFNGR
jgi:hypothetical protein